MKSLRKMTNEELWKLFLIILVPYDPLWDIDYQVEKDKITETVGDENIERISHIGSTAVPEILAKPTIDILLEIREYTDIVKLVKGIESIGYIFEKQPEKPAPHMMFMKGYTPGGFAEKVYHLHVRYWGDWDEFYFRDYLKAHPEEAERYELLKNELKIKYEHDRDAYTHAKTDFIKYILPKARSESGIDYGIKKESNISI